MGMSHDLEVAVEEGATMVRVGTAIFGERARQGKGMMLVLGDVLVGVGAVLRRAPPGLRLRPRRAAPSSPG